MNLTIKQYGLEKTGIRYTEKLIKDNFKAYFLQNHYGWVHSTPYSFLTRHRFDSFNFEVSNKEFYKLEKDDLIARMEIDESKCRYSKKKLNEMFIDNDIIFVFTFRHPYSWYCAMCKEYNIDIGKDYELNKDLINLYNVRNAQYINFLTRFFSLKRTLMVKHDELLRYPTQYLQMLKKVTEPKKENWIIEDRYVSNDGIGEKYDKTYEMNSEYMDNFSEKQINEFNSLLNEEVINFLKYKLIEFENKAKNNGKVLDN